MGGLSKGEREILIKVVAHVIPIYCINAFLIPVSIVDEIQRMIDSSWWGINKWRAWYVLVELGSLICL